MKHYYALLASERLLKRLSLIQLIVYFGSWFTNVAIYTLLIHLGAGAEMIALIAAMHFLPGVVQAPFTGVIIDKIHPRVLMHLVMILEILCTLLLLLIDSLSDMWLLMLLIFIRMGAASFYFTAEMSLLPRFLKGRKLQLANEIHSIIWSFSYTVGMALSGFVVYYVGVQTAIILDALMYLCAFVVLVGTPFHFTFHAATHKFYELFKATYTYIKTNKIVLHLMVLHSCVGLTAFDAIVALAADWHYKEIVAVPVAIGMMNASRAIGLIAGPPLFGKHLNTRRLFYLIVYQAVAVAVLALCIKSFYLSLFASLFVGLGTTVLWSYTYTLLQNNTDDAYYGRVVSYNDMIFLSVGASISYGIGLLSSMGVTLEGILLVIAALFLLFGLYYLKVYRWYLKD